MIGRFTGRNDWATRPSQWFDPRELAMLPQCNEMRDPSIIFHHTACYVRQPFRELVLPVLQPVESTPERVYRVGRVRRNVYIKRICESPFNSVITPWEDAIRLVELRGLRQYPNCGGFFFMQAKYDKIMVVRLTWSPSRNKWYIYACFPNDALLFPGCLIFSPKI